MPKINAPHPHIYAVITGDIVGSTKLSPGEMADVRGTISHTVREFAKRNSETVSKGVEFFQGDSWQLLLKDPCVALRLTLLIQAKLLAEYGVETRAAIGIGTVDGMEKTAATSTGEAFTLSGRALQKITGYFRLTGALPDRAGELARWFPAILHVCSGLTNSWTNRQAEVVGLWLSLVHPTDDAINAHLPTHQEIADKLDKPVKKQSVTDTLASARWRNMIEVLEMFQTTPWQELLKDGPSKERIG